MHHFCTIDHAKELRENDPEKARIGPKQPRKDPKRPWKGPNQPQKGPILEGRFSLKWRQSKWGLCKWGLKVLVHNCPRLPRIVVILRRKFPLLKGMRLQTIVHKLRGVALSPHSRASPHLDLSPRKPAFMRPVKIFQTEEGLAAKLVLIPCLSKSLHA